MTFPFSPYDFFGYLVGGFLVILSVERATGEHWVYDQDLKITTAAFWVGGAYIIGHIVANISSFFIEHKLVRGVIGCPEDLLFTDEPKAPDRPPLKARLGMKDWWLSWFNPRAWYRWAFPVGWRRGVFPIYFKPLPKETRERVIKRSTKEGFDKPGRALFYHCHAIVKRDKTAFDRMTSFINVYGLCRNVCMAGLVAAVALVCGACQDLRVVGWHIEGEPNRPLLWWAAAAVAVSVGMLYRYLKFFRHYTSEMFVSFAEPGEQPKPVADQPKQP
ncbi:MAG: hypothetical protein C0501_14205 [Isosphaera sp.]|nr:hypothetical protein [Isosphaera sp.]